MFLSHPLSLFSYNATATPDIYTLSLHDALPIYRASHGPRPPAPPEARKQQATLRPPRRAHLERAPRSASRSAARADRKSTRLNSSHTVISYAVFCLKKKKKKKQK